MSSPDSPCIGLCTLDIRRICKGCYRHIDEIADWALMSDDEKRAVLNEAASRNPRANMPSTGSTASGED